MFPRSLTTLVCCQLMLMALLLDDATAQTTPDPTNEHREVSPQADDAPWNLRTPTLGGAQFWTDYRVVGDWRIQQNTETEHFRLLDNRDFRHAWGTQFQCDQVLDGLIQDGTVKPDSGRLVILLHGLIRTSGSMKTLEQHFRQQGYATINLRYASTRKPVEDHARALKSVIGHLDPGVTDIFLIGHSLGNIVIRRYLGDTTDAATGIQGDPRIRSVVMLGPPNNGSKMAQLLKRNLVFNTVAGKCGAQLGAGWNQLEPTLVAPRVPFGIIAGGQDDSKWSNVFLSGKDDFTVSVAETKLVGASDFLVRPLIHSTMMNQPEVVEAAERFFRHGYFVSPEQCCPILPTDE